MKIFRVFSRVGFDVVACFCCKEVTLCRRLCKWKFTGCKKDSFYRLPSGQAVATTSCKNVETLPKTQPFLIQIAASHRSVR